jgi:integrase/recombinase XerD
VSPVEQKLIQHLTMEEMRAILKTMNLATRMGIRDRAMMHLCFAGGLRVSELVGAMVVNLVLGRTPNLLVEGKGRKHRSLPLWKDTATDVRAWLAVRGQTSAPELFVNAEGRAMTRAGFEYILDKHVRNAARNCPSLKGRSVSPHQLLHSCPSLCCKQPATSARSPSGSAMLISDLRKTTCA